MYQTGPGEGQGWGGGGGAGGAMAIRHTPGHISIYYNDDHIYYYIVRYQNKSSYAGSIITNNNNQYILSKTAPENSILGVCSINFFFRNEILFVFWAGSSLIKQLL